MENRGGTGEHAAGVLSPLRADRLHHKQNDVEYDGLKQNKDGDDSQAFDLFQAGLEIDIGIAHQHKIKNGENQRRFKFHVLAPRQEIIEEVREARTAED